MASNFIKSSAIVCSRSPLPCNCYKSSLYINCSDKHVFAPGKCTVAAAGNLSVQILYYKEIYSEFFLKPYFTILQAN